MYQDYYNDQFQNQEILSTAKEPPQKLKSTYEQELENYVNKESILPKILLRQKSASNYQRLNSKNRPKKKDSLSKVQDTSSVPKKSFSQYSIVKKKSRSNRYQSLDCNKSKSIQGNQKSLETINGLKRKSQPQSIKLKNQVPINKKYISLRNSNQISRKLTINNTIESQVRKIDQYFGHSRVELQKLSEDELNRLNNRLHQWIDRFNKKTDDMLLKMVPEQTKTKTIQNDVQRVKQILEKHILINKDLLKRIEEQNKKLQSQSGEMKEEQYEFLLDKEIERLVCKIKEQAKTIIQCKKSNQLSGTKIVAYDSKSSQQRFNQLKDKILQTRREEVNNQALLQKIDLKLAETQKTVENSDCALQKLLKQVGDKKAKVQQKQLQVRYNQTKKKIEKCKTTNAHHASALQKQTSNVKQQNKLLRNQIKHYQQELEELNTRIKTIVDKSNSMIQEKEQFLVKSKLLSSNSVQFFSKNINESPPKLAPCFTALKGIDIKNNIPEKDEIEWESAENHDQESSKKASNKGQTLQVDTIDQQQPENEFLQFEDNKNSQSLEGQKEKIATLTPKISTFSTQPKQLQQGKTMPSQEQQKGIKNPRRLLVKRVNNKEQK